MSSSNYLYKGAFNIEDVFSVTIMHRLIHDKSALCGLQVLESVNKIRRYHMNIQETRQPIVGEG